MHHAILRCLIAATVVLALAAPPAGASNLADLIPNLLGTEIRLAPPTGPFPSHAAHFRDESLALAATGRTLDQSLGQQFSSVPLANSAGGFSYTLDPALGTFTRNTDSFGPVFTERALTIGRGKLNLGFNYLQASYDKLDDLSLDSGAIQFQLGHQDVPGANFFEGDVIGVRTFLDLKSRTGVFFANYGVTDRIDVGVAVPIVKVDIDARAELKINRLSTAGQPTIHVFTNGTDSERLTASDSASGVGDVVLRGKLRVADWFATALDVRLPTGDEKNLLGTGFTQTKLTLLASGSFGRAGLHSNLGYSVASGNSSVLSDLPDELSYALGLDVAVHPRVTVAAEVLGRTLYDVTRVVSTQVSHSFQAGPGGPIQTTQLPQVTFARADQHLFYGSLGAKFNPGGNLLVSADALIPLSNDGLQAKGVVTVVGLEYSF
ncbi:MAG TPA: hypothetical protein VGV61_06755 [Thermoanaerobaculia bacterium]|jgi:hypothetical protein|nr:hypothetical protein [Thermoanaerobaculia bacterium]